MLAHLASYFKKYSLGAFLISDALNVRYLTGYTGTNGLVVATPRQLFFFTDFRYFAQADLEVSGAKIIRAKKDLLSSAIDFLHYKKISVVGFETSAATYSDFLRLKKQACGIKLIAVNEPSDMMRIIKSAKEIKLLTKAAAINTQAFQKILPLIKPGIRENTLAWELEKALREAGAESLAFATIVASGARGALPHGVASNKKLKNGELVTIDFGGVYHGYCADETCTVALGAISAKQKNIYDIVCEAQARAIALARPGVSCASLDLAARKYIKSKGYGQYFGHALGHGVGLAVHERPLLSAKSPDTLAPGMVFTIEPGIYIPNLGGVRIEDMFVCTNTGARRLTKIDKKLITL